MENPKKTMFKQLLSGLVMIVFVTFISTSCNQKSTTTTTTPEVGKVHPLIETYLAATIKDDWNGGSPTTEANDSFLYHSGTNSYKSYTNASGAAPLTDTNYTPGTPIVMEACANGEICGKVFNQAYSKPTEDANYISPTFTITALATGDSIPVKILVTDTNGVAYSGYSVQFTQGGVNYGSAGTTNSSGSVTYGRQLAQGQTYVCTASGTAGSASATVSTSPMSGSSGNFSGIAVYIRFK